MHHVEQILENGILQRLQHHDAAVRAVMWVGQPEGYLRQWQ